MFFEFCLEIINNFNNLWKTRYKNNSVKQATNDAFLHHKQIILNYIISKIVYLKLK